VIVAFSTSSRLASVALIGPDGTLIWAGEEEAPQAASGACMRLLQEGLNAAKTSLNAATLFASDLGPGSFTGVRVGVTLAKTFAFAQQVKACGLPAFDLIASDRIVVLPSKRGEWFVREPGREAYRVNELPSVDFIGFGPGIAEQTFPHAMGFVSQVARLQLVDPEQLVPAYLIEPSISLPKKPYVVADAH
jgi:tRNA threonylcarbamoyladenosine biosynthesis protein TsaB